MRDQRFIENDRALPPVVGVILMVAITIILAATVSAFLFGFTGLLQSPPQTAFGFDYDPGGSGVCDLSTGGNDGVLTVSPESGDAIDAERVTLTANGTEVSWNDCGGGNEVNATSEITVSVDEDQTVRVIWTAADGDRTQTIGKWEGVEG